MRRELRPTSKSGSPPYSTVLNSSYSESIPLLNFSFRNTLIVYSKMFRGDSGLGTKVLRHLLGTIPSKI